MTIVVALATAAAGGTGALLRYGLGVVAARRRAPSWPWPTIVINVTGSFALGLLTGLPLPDAGTWLAIVGTGALGGYTTFSTASVDVLRLLRRRAWWPVAAVAFGTGAVALLSAVLGLMLGRSL